MAGEFNISFADTLRSPDSVFSIRTQNRDFNTEAFDREEANLFETQFNTFVNDFDSRMVSELFVQRADQIALAANHAKQNFDERRFGGINSGDNEIAFDVIRPGHIRADPESGDVINDWEYEVGAGEDGWNDWVGDGTSDNDYTVDEDQVIIMMGLQLLNVGDETDETSLSGINIQRFGRNVDMLPKDLYNMTVSDNENDVFMQALPTVIATDRDRIHMRLRSDEEDATYDVRPLGLTFGVGAFMNQEDF